MGLKKGIQGATIAPPAPEVTTKVSDPEPAQAEAKPEPKAPEPAPEPKAKPVKAAPVTKTYTKPEFLPQSQRLIDNLRNYSAPDLARLMHLSPKLAELNFQRYRDWHTPFTTDNAKQAVLAMKGDVYAGLDAETFNEEDFAFAQNHLRILSGLYGLMRPLDLMHQCMMQ